MGGAGSKKGFSLRSEKRRKVKWKRAQETPVAWNCGKESKHVYHHEDGRKLRDNVERAYSLWHDKKENSAAEMLSSSAPTLLDHHQTTTRQSKCSSGTAISSLSALSIAASSSRRENTQRSISKSDGAKPEQLQQKAKQTEEEKKGKGKQRAPPPLEREVEPALSGATKKNDNCSLRVNRNGSDQNESGALLSSGNFIPATDQLEKDSEEALHKRKRRKRRKRRKKKKGGGKGVGGGWEGVGGKKKGVGRGEGKTTKRKKRRRKQSAPPLDHWDSDVPLWLTTAIERQEDHDIGVWRKREDKQSSKEGEALELLFDDLLEEVNIKLLSTSSTPSTPPAAQPWDLEPRQQPLPLAGQTCLTQANQLIEVKPDGDTDSHDGSAGADSQDKEIAKQPTFLVEEEEKWHVARRGDKKEATNSHEIHLCNVSEDSCDQIQDDQRTDSKMKRVDSKGVGEAYKEPLMNGPRQSRANCQPHSQLQPSPRIQQGGVPPQRSYEGVAPAVREVETQMKGLKSLALASTRKTGSVRDLVTIWELRGKAVGQSPYHSHLSQTSSSTTGPSRLSGSANLHLNSPPRKASRRGASLGLSGVGALNKILTKIDSKEGFSDDHLQGKPTQGVLLHGWRAFADQEGLAQFTSGHDNGKVNKGLGRWTSESASDHQVATQLPSGTTVLQLTKHLLSDCEEKN